MSYIYVAAPYSHDMMSMRHNRLHSVASYVHHIIVKGGITAFSPVLHCVEMERTLRLSPSFGYWSQFCLDMLNSAALLEVLTLDGWKESVGVQAEAKHWFDILEMNSIHLICPKTYTMRKLNQEQYANEIHP